MDYIQTLETEMDKIISEAAKQLKKVVKPAVVQSFKNGIEVGKGRKAGKQAGQNRKATTGKGFKPKA
jgi:hypothetical protein